jgi:hypothetical protein
MFQKVEKILLKKYELHSKKFELLRTLRLKKYFEAIRIITQVHLIINKELLLNKKLIELLKKENISEEIKGKFVVPILINLIEINNVLNAENRVLYRNNLTKYSYAYLQSLFRKNKFYARKLRKFWELTEKELELQKVFLTLWNELPKGFDEEKEFKSSFKLLVELQKELKKFKDAAGNSELVKKQGEKVLKIIKAVQKTEIYGFIKIDVLFIKEKVEYIVKHPKENKLAYFLATVYIIAPLTFEMTGAILFFRYLGKYSISKGKMIRERFAR